MTLIKQIRTILGVAILLAGLMAVALFYSFDRIRSSVKVGAISSDIIHNVFELDVLLHTYLLEHDERSGRQWKSKKNSLTKIIGSIRQSSSSIEEREYVRRLSNNLDILNEQFEELVRYRQTQTASVQTGFQLDEKAQILKTSVLVPAELLVADAFRLAELSRVRIREEMIRVAAWIMGLAILLVASVAVAVRFINQRVIRVAQELGVGAQEFGNGRLDYRIIIKRSDEMGRVASAFNEMAARLADLYGQMKVREAQLHKNSVALKKSNADLRNFGYVASHDLKSPLRGIDQLATWIVDDLGVGLDAGTKKHLSLMRSRIKRMETLLDDLLEYSRLDKRDHELREVDTRFALKEIFDFLSEQENAVLTVADDMPTFKTLRIPLEMVFRNLIHNAIKHRDNSRAKIDVSVNFTTDGYAFSVADNGPGIAPQHHERVFGIFQTLRPRDELEGSGMGLSMVKKAVEGVGGVISLHSDGIRGTRIIFTWPNEANLMRHLNDE